MRLLKPSPGECVDRQTILDLKCKYGSGGMEPYTDVESREEEHEDHIEGRSRQIIRNASPINIQPFIDENNMIQDYLEKNWIPDLRTSFESLYNKIWEELAEVNHEIWKLTDQSHVLKDAPDKMQTQANKRAAEVLFLITELNDKRANLVRQLNELFDIRTVEKIFV